MKGNKDLFKCVKKVKQLTLHCIDTIAIQWQIKGLFLKAMQMNETETEEMRNKMNEIEDKDLTEEQSEQKPTSHQLICCVLNELFDCMEYTVNKECNDKAFQELKQIHVLFTEDNYSCDKGDRTPFCDKMLRQRKQAEEEEEPDITSGEGFKSIQFFPIIFHLIIFFVFMK